MLSLKAWLNNLIINQIVVILAMLILAATEVITALLAKKFLGLEGMENTIWT